MCERFLEVGSRTTRLRKDLRDDSLLLDLRRMCGETESRKKTDKLAAMNGKIVVS